MGVENHLQYNMKVVVSGCSHSVNDYEAINGNGYFDLFAKGTNLDLVNLSEKGISNDRILEKVFEVIYNTKDINTIIVQFTYLHRLSLKYKITGDYLHFQPSKTFDDFEIESSWTKKQLLKKFTDEDAKFYHFDKNDIVKTLSDFYQYYLVYGFDSIEQINKIKLQLQILQDLCKLKGIKLICLWYDETPIDNDLFIKIDNYTSLHKWQIDSNLFIANKNFHLKKEGHMILADEIINKWKKLV